MSKEKSMGAGRQAVTIVVVIALIFTLLAGLGLFQPRDRVTQTTEPITTPNTPNQ